ncbi:MAG: hypothetical protein ACRCZF_26325, partial [Gemmataceae bacterium]
PPFRDSGIIFEDGFQSLDKVMNPATGEFFSSKPPLLATLMAAEYAVLYHGFGWNFQTHRWPIVITLLLTWNVLPFALMLRSLARMLDAIAVSDAARLFVMLIAAFATFHTTFIATINNHTPAIWAIVFAIELFTCASGRWHRHFLAGLCLGFAATCELPAACFVAFVFCVQLWRQPGPTLRAFLPGLLLPVLALVACNFAALGTLRPAYTEFGGPWYEYGGSHWLKLKDPIRPRGIDFNQEPPGIYLFHMLLGHHGWFSLTPVWLLGIVGIGRAIGDAVRRRAFDWYSVGLPIMAGLCTLILTAFYLSRTQSYNYGGNTSGLRWFFWTTPLWLWATLRGYETLRHWRHLPRIAGVLLLLSAISVYYPAWNPWRYPWIHQLLEYTGIVRY